MNSGYLASSYQTGPEVGALERQLENLFGCSAIAVNSGTSGLLCALAYYLYGTRRQEVIVTPFSMSASAVLPLWFGATPVFADIEPEYLCLDCKDVERKITKYTAGIVAVDIFGHPFSKNLSELAEKHGLWVVEDACQAIGAKRDGRMCGTLGDLGVLSFNEHKHVSCGEGGAILVNNMEKVNKLRELMNHGECKNSLVPGLNLRMTENNAAAVCKQLGRLNSILEPYRELGHEYSIPVHPKCQSVYYKLHTYVPNLHGFSRGYVDPLYKLPIFKAELDKSRNSTANCPVCEAVSRIIWIQDTKTAISKEG